MSRGAFAFFLVIGLLATVALAIPGAVFVAALFLIVPGVVLWLSVPIFMYAAFVYAARHLTGGLRRPVRLAIVVGAVAALAVIPTWLLNQRTDAQRSELVAHDVAGEIPTLRNKTLAVITPSRHHHGGTPRGDTDCD